MPLLHRDLVASFSASTKRLAQRLTRRGYAHFKVDQRLASQVAQQHGLTYVVAAPTNLATCSECHCIMARAGFRTLSRLLYSIHATGLALDKGNDPVAFTSQGLDSLNTPIEGIPGGWADLKCYRPPCTVFCHEGDADCLKAANVAVSKCSPQWSSYYDPGAATLDPLKPWANATSTYGHPSTVSTETTLVWTSFSTATTGIVVKNHNESGHPTTMTPVWVLGSPVPSTIVTTLPDNREYYTILTGPVPTCSFVEVKTANPSLCGQCQIVGGTVDLYFWPPTTKTAEVNGSATSLVQSTVLDGTTLFAPSVYLQMRSVFATNECSRVGKTYKSTLLAVDPGELSTQIHIGGKVAQTGANEYSKLDYGDLVGLPPLSQYEMQPSCIMFGCPTIYPTSWNPTLVVPTQVRQLDPAWQSCSFGLEGLYDPPQALTPQVAMAQPTTTPPMPYSGTKSASPGATLSPSLSASQVATTIVVAVPTDTPTGTHLSSSTKGESSLASEAPLSSESPTISSEEQNQGTYSAAIIDDPEPSSTPHSRARSSDIIGSVDIASESRSAGLQSTTVGRSHAAAAATIILVTGTTSTVLGSAALAMTLPSRSTPASALPAQSATSDEVPGLSVTIQIDGHGGDVVNGNTLAIGSNVIVSDATTSLTLSILSSARAGFLAVGTLTTVLYRMKR